MHRFNIIILLALAACAKPPGMEEPPVGPLIQRITSQIRRQKDFLSFDNSAFNRRPAGAILLRPATIADTVLLTAMSARFHGTVEDLIQSVAARIHYRTCKRGQRSPAPSLIALSRPRDTAYALLEEGVLQTHGGVRLQIDQRKRIITVIYRRAGFAPLAHPDDTRL